MKEEITFNRFCDLFRESNRDNNFSYEGKKALYDYLEELEEDTGQENELDIIALCCDYGEYSDLNEYLTDYSNTHDKKLEDEDDDDFKQRIEEEISDKTTLIKIDEDLNNGFIIQCY